LGGGLGGGGRGSDCSEVTAGFRACEPLRGGAGPAHLDGAKTVA